jgi:adhesin transport system membrane fusion protein
MTMLLLMGLCGFLLWAALFDIDQSVRAQGQVIPSNRSQIIQAADGGVLSQILVEEGQSVMAGQRLAVLEADRSHAGYEESRAKAAALAAALERTQAEASGKPLIFKQTIVDFPEFIAVQKALYEQRKLSLNEELTTLQEGLVMAQEELKMNGDLIITGDTSRLEVMRTKRQLADIKGKINATKNKYKQDARIEATKIEEEQATNHYKLEERQSVLGHTELNSPVTGIVKYLKITTIGGVLRAGDELMQISPTEGDMIIETKVNPVDIGQLSLELPVTIKLDAYDYSTFGTLNGSVTHISSDTLTETGSKGEANTFYRVNVKVSADKLQDNPKFAKMILKPGMTATVDIRTDSRSVLKYLAKPLFKAFGGALNER